MHTTLDLNLVRVVLTFDKKPMVDATGQVLRGTKGEVEFVRKEGSTEYELNTKEYIVFDTSKDAP